MCQMCCVDVAWAAPQVYHDLIPVICRLLDFNKPRIRRAVLTGAHPTLLNSGRTSAFTGLPAVSAGLTWLSHVTTCLNVHRL